MNLRISRRHHGQLLNWASDAFPIECCGLILGQFGQVTDLLLAANVALDPNTHFEIDPAVLIAAQKAERSDNVLILGYFHSHPNGLEMPSCTDADMALADGRIWLIIAADTVSAWVASERGKLHGRFDNILLVVEEDGRG